MKKKLIILDLDNTLIYAAYSKRSANTLFKYSKYLTIIERPFAREFVQKCHAKGDVVVFTTAVKDYAQKVCEHLRITPVELFSRDDFLVVNDRFVKRVPDYYYKKYDEIVIVDDLPDIWDSKSHDKCRVVEVMPFIGYDGDDELIRIKV